MRNVKVQKRQKKKMSKKKKPNNNYKIEKNEIKL